VGEMRPVSQGPRNFGAERLRGRVVAPDLQCRVLDRSSASNEES
jgi:hypothetical protein